MNLPLIFGIFVGAALLTYLVKLVFAELIKGLAASETLCFFLKENREVQIDAGQKFEQFVLSKAGYSYAFQRKNASSKYKDVAKKIPWDSERDKWFIKENNEFSLETSPELSWFQKWCLRELGIYWFGGFLFQRNLRYREIDIYTIEMVEQEVDEGGKKKKIKIPTLKKVLPTRSKYLYATATVYGYELINAEDSTGNPLNILFTAIAENENPYITWIENERWDNRQREVALDRALKEVRKEPFVHVHKLIATKTSGETLPPNDTSVIADNFCKQVLDALNDLNDGFRYTDVTLRNVDPSNENMRDSILSVFTSENEAQVISNLADAEAGKITRVEGAKNEKYKERVKITAENPQAAMISQMPETFRNLKALSLDKNSNLFTSFLNLEGDEKTSTKEKGDSDEKAA
jgi:hypothetical protein